MYIKDNIIEKVRKLLKTEEGTDQIVYDLITATRGPDETRMGAHKTVFTATIRGKTSPGVIGLIRDYNDLLEVARGNRTTEVVPEALIREAMHTERDAYLHYINHVRDALRAMRPFMDTAEDKGIISGLEEMANELAGYAVDRSGEETCKEHLRKTWTKVASLLSKR